MNGVYRLFSQNVAALVYLLCGLMGFAVSAESPAQEFVSSGNEELPSTVELEGAEKRDELFSKAKADYDSGFYELSARGFDALHKAGWTGLEVCYNAGTAYLHAGNLGRAILYLERAKLFSPGDREVQLNREFAQMLTVDEIEILPRPLLVTWYNKLVALLSWMGWLKWAGILMWFSGSMYFLARTERISGKGQMFIRALYISMAVASCAMGIIGIQQHASAKHRIPAVILDDTVYVKNEPNKDATDLFILHEGAVVDAGRSIGSWTKIQLSDGKIGWVSTAGIEAI